MRLPENVSESVKKLNPSLYGSGVAKVGGEKREQDPQSTLGTNLPGEQKGPQPLAQRVYKVKIISFRRRLLDDDNTTSGGNKAIRDAIAESLRVDDGDTKRISFRYEQIKVETKDEEGTLVKIDTYHLAS